jgi:hypothetical protein
LGGLATALPAAHSRAKMATIATRITIVLLFIFVSPFFDHPLVVLSLAANLLVNLDTVERMVFPPWLMF